MTDKEWAALEQEVLEDLMDRLGYTEKEAMEVFIEGTSLFLDTLEQSTPDQLIDLFRSYSVADEWDGSMTPLQQWRFAMVEKALRNRLQTLVPLVPKG